MVSPTALRPLWAKFPSSPLSARLARGVFWSLIGAAVARGTGVLSAIIVARVLGISAFGEFTIIQSTVGLFGTFAGLGLGITATKYVAELRESDPQRCGRVISLILLIAVAGGIVAGIALFVFADWLATRTLAAPQLAPILRYGCALALFTALQGVYTGALGGFEAFKRVAQINWIGAMLGTSAMVGCTFAAGLPGAVWGSVLQVAISCVLGHIALSKEAARCGVKMMWPSHLEDFRILWRFSLPAFLSSILISPANWACNTLLVNQDHGFREIALVNAAGQWKNFLSFLPLMMTSVLVPIFSNLYHAGEAQTFNKLLWKNVLTNFCVCLLLALPLAILAPWILERYGSVFRQGVPIFLITIGGTALVAVNNLFSRAMQATGRAWLDFGFTAIWSAVLVSACFFLIPAHKGVGLAVAHLLAAVALGAGQWIFIRRLFIRNSVSEKTAIP
ncbi:MAG TPA: oligosaccharide flippase family protein [Verrucomicrobiae bacterium]|nr:oligosaccharide flippase family protein [Verrucomicrobiae bacterium]